VVAMEITAFYVTPCSMVDIHQGFGERAGYTISPEGLISFCECQLITQTTLKFN
jgi:hypothetical protein